MEDVTEEREKEMTNSSYLGIPQAWVGAWVGGNFTEILNSF